MTTTLPRIATAVAVGGMQVLVTWRGRDTDGTAQIDLSGWIGTGGDVLAPLKRPEVFREVAIGDYGASLTWDRGEGDLSIDAEHLRRLFDAQEPFRAPPGPGSVFIRDWQERTGLSNQEAASLLGIVPSTWSAYKAGKTLPRALALLLQAVLRDPLILQAHYRPRQAGRPRRSEPEAAN